MIEEETEKKRVIIAHAKERDEEESWLQWKKVNAIKSIHKDGAGKWAQLERRQSILEMESVDLKKTFLKYIIY